ncbi:MAG: hypothetical protein B6D64_01295 [Bacteroidetes bacterium 4484_276]|nr:MAG: hypothetical protein B6D64_01295 [Bacteroidetes bacterium 4484_276]OYT14201.1 MAG: hypothetical protein B6I19_01220 [Bacteroidetes bacterium 4572_114]
MKIIEQYSEKQFDKIEIGFANYIGDYAIRIKFKDGNEKLVDFKPFLKKSQHPSISKYLKENLFSSFKIIDGNLNWNDYDLIFPVWDLYNGRIE